MITKDELQKLYQYSNALTKHDEGAYDLVHQAVIKVQKYSPSNTLAYCKTTIRNLFYDKYKKEKKYEAYERDEKSDLNLEQMVVDRFTVKRILKGLGAQDREILYLWSVEGMTFEEISKEMDLKLGTILSRVSRLKSKIKSQELKHE